MATLFIGRFSCSFFSFFDKEASVVSRPWQGAVSKGKLGSTHIQTIDCMFALASTYQMTGRREESDASVLETLALRKTHLGEHHRFTLDAKLDLAAIFYFDQRLSEVLQLEEEVLKKRIEMLGPDHIITLGSMKSLAFMLRAQGHVSDAMELVRKGCEAYEKITSPGTEGLWRFMETFERFSCEQEERRTRS